jgi:hypothetical protein
VRERVTRGALPPDEAYWWARIAAAEATILEDLPV